MPTFNYYGQILLIDTLYSYARVSSSVQTIEAGGEGIPRQLELNANFANEYGIHQDDLTGLQFVDEDRSGSKGEHLLDGGGLAAFMALATKGKLGPNPGLTIEGFSRLSRLPIDTAMELFLAIIRSGVTLINLTGRRAYTRASIRANQGQIYEVASAMWAARAQTDAMADYTARSWRIRRGTVRGLCPAWFIKKADGVIVAGFKGLSKNAVLTIEIDPIKATIIIRIFTMALTMGLNTIVRVLNAEGVPLLSDIKRKRAAPMWEKSMLSELIRGRLVLGEQAIGRYVDGKRELTGNVIKEAYEPVISEDLWLAANAALDGRKRGVGTGRNVTKYANLFGTLARCDVCGDRMKIRQKGRRGQYYYLGCSNAASGGCDATAYHRLDRVEQRVLAFFEARALGDWTPEPEIDRSSVIQVQIDRARKDAAKLETAHEQSLLRSGALAEKTQAKLEADYDAKQTEIRDLERQLASAKTAKQVDEQIATVKRLAGVLDGLDSDALVSARRQIATALPGILTAIRFQPSGYFIAVGNGWTIDFHDQDGMVQWIRRQPDLKRGRGGKVRWQQPKAV